MILYEDEAIIVCHKKAGIPVQSARIGQKDMVSILNNHLVGHSTELIRVVHRLDQPVEGVIVFAKTQKAAAKLSRQITEGSVKKKYQAVCCITEKAKKRFILRSEEKYDLVDYLSKNPKTNTSSVVRPGDKSAKRAELSFRILDMRQQYLLAEIDLKTGRHHQIRVQMANAGLPLYGDQKYNTKWQEFQRSGWAPGSENITGTVRCLDKPENLALCAVSLTFRHPVSGKIMEFEVRPEAEIFGCS